jgi:iron complex transport system ATP-binding protein
VHLCDETSASGVRFRYRREWVLNDVSLLVRPSEICGIVGRNGSGKTTLLKILSRLLVPLAGTVSYGSRPAESLTVVERAAWIGYLPQETSIPFPYRVDEVVACGRAGRSFHFFSENPEDRDLVWRALSALALEPYSDRLVDTLSAGERQRVSLARLLAQNPRFLLLDEPTVFLDPGQKAALAKTLRTLRGSGYGIAIASHDRDLWSSFDRVYVLADGVVSEMPPARLSEPDVVAALFPEPSYGSFVAGENVGRLIP